MKKYILALALISIAISSFAQDGRRDDKREQMKALQIAFITEKLDLSPEESQKFWPIHNDFEERSSNLRSKSRRAKKVEDMTDEEASAFINSRMSVEEQLLASRKVYLEDLKSVLPPKKIALLFEIEHEFKRKMLRSIREQRHEKKRNN